MIPEIGTKESPLWMQFVPRPIDKKALIAAIAVSVVPAAIVILMQRPDLRQIMQMRFFHTSKLICQHTADVFQKMATKSAQEYNKVRL